MGCNTAPNGGIAQNLLSDVAVAGLTNGPAPITTSFADTHLDTTLPPNFGDNFTPSPLAVQPRDASGAYLLSPGFYEMTSRSYCLNAGLHGPSSGDGYLYASLTGSAADIIGTLIRNSDAKPDIRQTTVQLLIWAVLARAKFDSLNSDLKTAAIELLSPQQIYELNGGALGLIPDAVIQQAVASLPANVQQAIATANRMRTLLAQASVSYADAEQLAVPAGSPPTGQSYPEGSWSGHPNGYYVRYFPNGYSTTRVQVYVPDPPPAGASSTLASMVYDAVNSVAAAANTLKQLLAQSNAPAGSSASSSSSNSSSTSSGGGPPPPPPPPPPAPKLELLLLNGLTQDFGGGTPTRITDPDLSPDNTAAGNFVLLNDGIDLLGADPFPQGRSSQPSYCYSLMVIGKITFPAGSKAPAPTAIACTWNRKFQQRLVAINKSADGSQWIVTSLSPSLDLANGFPMPASDVNNTPNTISAFNSTFSPKYVVYAYDNPGAMVKWAQSFKPGDYLLLENVFTCILDAQAPDAPMVEQTLKVGQQLVLQRGATQPAPVSNVVSTLILPDCQMPSDAAHQAIIRGIVGGNLPIVIDAHANDPWP